MNNKIIDWLLEDKNPEVKLRTQIELLNENEAEINITKELLKSSKPFEKNWQLLESEKPWSVCYGLTTLAEWGFTRYDIDLDKYVDWIINRTEFKLQCGEGMLLRTLIKLGYHNYERVKDEINSIYQLNSDGGFQCISKNKKINDSKLSHKSCYRLTATYLLLLAELKRVGVSLDCEETFMEYFLKRDILFRTDDMQRIVVDGYNDTHFPTDCIKHGVQEILYALSILGYGNHPACERIWELADTHKTEEGKYILTSSPAKPYFSIGAKGKENKWITLYMLMAQA